MILNKLLLKLEEEIMKVYWPLPNFNTVKTQSISRNSSYTFDHPVYISGFTANGTSQDSAYVSISHNGNALIQTVGSGHQTKSVTLGMVVPAGTKVAHSNYGSASVTYCEIAWTEIPEIITGGQS